jgi:hypothetical protein
MSPFPKDVGTVKAVPTERAVLAGFASAPAAVEMQAQPNLSAIRAGIAATRAVLAADLVTLDPSDALPWKWVGFLVVAGGTVAAAYWVNQQAPVSYDALESATERRTRSRPRSPTPEPDPSRPPPLPLPLPLPGATREDERRERLCRDFGTWGPDNNNNDPGSPAYIYQGRITGRPGEQFTVTGADGRPLSIDGCRDRLSNPTLTDVLFQEAKGTHELWFLGDDRYRFVEQVREQGRRQQEFARANGVQVEWHFQSAIDQREVRRVWNADPDPDRKITLPNYHTP